MKISNANKIVGKLKETYNMRGAMLLDVDTLDRLEPDKERGIRATYMDEDYSVMQENKEVKNPIMKPLF